MSPLTNSQNVTATAAEQPEYSVLWEPYAFNPASVATVSPFPTAAGGGYAVPGCALMYGLTGTQAGVGAYPPLGPTTSYPGGDSPSNNPTFPYNWTVQYVDIASTSTTVATGLAGVCIGWGSLGGFANPQALTTPANTSSSSTAPGQICMVAKRGLVQLLMDDTTTVGHTVKVSTTHTGQFSDAGTTTWTFGTSVGIVQQAVTTTVPLLVWCSVNFPV